MWTFHTQKRFLNCSTEMWKHWCEGFLGGRAVTLLLAGNRPPQGDVFLCCTPLLVKGN